MLGTRVVPAGILTSANPGLSRAAISVPYLEPPEEVGAWPWIFLGALGQLFTVSVLRQGTRGFIAQVISWHGRDEHDHGDECGSCCGAHEPGQG
jgi:hypothetical protein